MKNPSPDDVLAALKTLYGCEVGPATLVICLPDDGGVVMRTVIMPDTGDDKAEGK
jgi:hypothetical protein